MGHYYVHPVQFVETGFLAGKSEVLHCETVFRNEHYARGYACSQSRSTGREYRVYGDCLSKPGGGVIAVYFDGHDYTETQAVS